MFRQALLSVAVGGFFLAIGGSTASAQEIDYNNWTRHNHGAPAAESPSQPQVGKHRKHQQAQQAQQDKEQQAEDARGWDGVGQDPDKIPFSKDTPDPDDADEPSGDGSILGHRNIPK